MTTHSSILVWKLPWTEEPGRLQSKVSQSVRHSYARTHAFDQPLFFMKICVSVDTAVFIAVSVI